MNDYAVEGTEIITNKGTNSDGKPYYTVEIQNGKVTTPEGDQILRSGTQEYTWVDGYTTPNVSSDDAWSVSGTMNGTTRKGSTYLVTVSDTDPIIKAVSCKWAHSGTAEITNTGNGSGYTLDFSEGGGGCDGVVKVTWSGLSFNYTMP